MFLLGWIGRGIRDVRQTASLRLSKHCGLCGAVPNARLNREEQSRVLGRVGRRSGAVWPGSRLVSLGAGRIIALPPEIPKSIQKAPPALFDPVTSHSVLLGSTNIALVSASVVRGPLIRHEPQLRKDQFAQHWNSEHATQQLDRNQR